jgi:hypothetical protein
VSRQDRDTEREREGGRREGGGREREQQSERCPKRQYIKS